MSQQMVLDRSGRRPPWYLRLQAMALLTIARMLVHRMPLPRVAEMLSRCNRYARRPASDFEAERALDVLAGSSLLCAAGRDSIGCALAAALFCASRRTYARWCVGMRTPPPEMHGWIEVHGRPVRQGVDVHVAYPALVTAADRAVVTAE